MSGHDNNSTGKLTPYLSPAAVWALSVGTSIGWGSLVVTSNTYLSQAGPLGSVLGILIGTVIMLIMNWNYAYLAQMYPSAGGIYTYTKNVFGYDRGFLISWFTGLTYIAMFWANATSLPLFARYFFGDTFRFGYMYSVFGYEVYIGEALISVAAIALITLLCIKSRKITGIVMTALVFVFMIGVSVCFVIAFIRGVGGNMSIDPLFVPDDNAFSQVLHVALISPWAFVGFESITHMSEEFNFPVKKIFRILTVSVISVTALYVFVTLLSVTAYPPEYDSWFSYVRDLENIRGLNGLPAFYAAKHYLGDAGTAILFCSLFAIIVTSLIGNMTVLSRLFNDLAKDEILPAAVSKLDKRNVPVKAMLVVSVISMIIPFFGRTAIGWIVDVTTLGATLMYGFVSACAMKAARGRNKRVFVTGAAGLVLMIVFGAVLLLPDLISSDTLATETYFLFIVWSILGFIYFRRIISKDHARRFGKAIIVWIALLSLVVFMAVVWMDRVYEQTASSAVIEVREFYEGAGKDATREEAEAFTDQIMDDLHKTSDMSTFLFIGLFALSLGVMLSNHFSMKKWERKAVKERDSAREVAYRDPLTGVKSKNAFVETEERINGSIADGKCGAFAVAVCDVNGLKHINDTLGHKAGDEYIRQAATLICDHFKHSPVFRIGGDEFVVLLDGADHENMNEIFEGMNKEIENNIGTGKAVVSVGCSDYVPGSDKSLHDVFERADELMYKRKMQLKSMGAVTRE